MNAFPLSIHDQLSNPGLLMAAEVLDDLERIRIANENRLRQMTRDAVDKDGEDRGLGLSEDHPEVARLRAIVDAMVAIEQDAIKNLTKVLKEHPLYATLKPLRGVGDKQAARLLAELGDPYWNTLHERPRTVSELWSYSGCRVVNGAGVRRQKGTVVNWNPDSRKRLYVITESVVKSLTAGCKTEDGIQHAEDCPCGPLRRLYDARKAHTEGNTHAQDCVRCGPSGKPAKAGSPWSDAHRHNDAMRIVGKELLKMLWLAARDLHAAGGGANSVARTHGTFAPPLAA